MTLLLFLLKTQGEYQPLCRAVQIKLFLKCLWEEKSTFIRCTKMRMCLNHAFLGGRKKKNGAYLLCGHLELKKLCLSTQYIPRCMYFYKSNPMDFRL